MNNNGPVFTNPLWEVTDKEYAPLIMNDISDFNFGETLTHEDFNYYINKVFEYSKYNTEVLTNLFNEESEGEVYRIPYLDKRMTHVEERATDNANSCYNNAMNISRAQEQINNILDGTLTVGHSVIADELTGIREAGPLEYYGTSKDRAIGFHSMPPMVYTREISEAPNVSVDGIYFKPSLDSVSEAMLTPELRNKINAISTLNVEALADMPSMMTLDADNDEDFIVERVETPDYLTEIPSDVVRRNELDNYIKTNALEEMINRMTSETNAHTDLTYNKMHGEITDLAERVRNTCPRIFINQEPANPKVGDMVVIL